MFPHGGSSPGLLESYWWSVCAYLDAYGDTLALGIVIGLVIAMIGNLLVEKPKHT